MHLLHYLALSYRFAQEMTNIRNNGPLGYASLTQPCIIGIRYAREVKDIGQAGEGESEPNLKVNNLKRRSDPFTLVSQRSDGI